ncbi:MAG: hypothetical protein AB2797_09250 [Candidatus Thiodiazotropha sp.]
MNRKLNMSSKKEKPGIAIVVIAALASITWVAFLSGCLFSNHILLMTLDLNELGDLIAGSFAPLAALWLIVTATLQRLQFSYQMKEFTASVEQVERQANAAAAEIHLTQHNQHLKTMWKQIEKLSDTFNSIMIREENSKISAFCEEGGYEHYITIGDYTHAEMDFIRRLKTITKASVENSHSSLIASNSQVLELVERLQLIQQECHKTASQQKKTPEEFQQNLPGTKVDLLDSILSDTIVALKRLIGN